MSYHLVFTAVSNLKEARNLAEILLREKLAACISISSPMESHYVWKGKREKSREYLLIIKTRQKLYPRLQQILLKHHSYEVPEIIALPIEKGYSKYLSWIKKQT